MSEGTHQYSPCLPQPYPPGIQTEAKLGTEGNMCDKEGVWVFYSSSFTKYIVNFA